MSKKQILRVELTRPAKFQLAKMTERMGMTQVALMSRVGEFFTKQENLLQSAILGRYPKEIEADVAELILKKKAK